MWEKHGFKAVLKGGDDLSDLFGQLERFELYQSGLNVLREINNDVSFLVRPRRIRSLRINLLH
jgi:hypothetical protein